MFTLLNREMQIDHTIDGRYYNSVAFRHSRNYYKFGSVFTSNADACELYVHIKGASNALIGNRSYPLQHGDIMVYKPSEPHKHLVTASDEYERFVIFFQPECLCFMDGIRENLVNCFCDRPDYESNRIILTPQALNPFLRLLYSMSELCDAPGFGAKVTLYSYFIQALQMVNDAYRHLKNTPFQGSRFPSIVDKALDIIEQGFIDFESLSQLAVQLNVSKSYLSGVFKKNTGISVYEYVQSLRLYHAKKLLLDGASVTEAGLDSGFRDYSYFIQYFKKKIGITPYQFQKQARLSGGSPSELPSVDNGEYVLRQE